MEQPEVKEPLATLAASANDPPAPLVPAPGPPASPPLSPPGPTLGGMMPAIKGGAAAPTYAYVIGRIDPQFPNEEVEKEFNQARAREDTGGMTDRQALQRVLSQRQNRYLLRELCWVIKVREVEAYILFPEYLDWDLLADTLRPTPSAMDMDVAIGTVGPLPPPGRCGGLILPLLRFSQIYSFDRKALIEALPRPEQLTAEAFGPMAEELLDRVLQMAGNLGATHESRAINYLATRYPAIYHKAAEAFGRNMSLTAVRSRLSRLNTPTRILVDVFLEFTDLKTGVPEKYAAVVNATGKYPSLHAPLTPTYDH